MPVLILSHHDVQAALPPQACAEAMAAVLAAYARGETYQPLRSVQVPPDAAGFMGLMPCWRGPPGRPAPAFAPQALRPMPRKPPPGPRARPGAGPPFDGGTRL